MKLTIFKRKKATIPEPYFEDNWKNDKYEMNIKKGVDALRRGVEVDIYDDGRGYELALDIKRQFIVEYQKQLSEKIKISHYGNKILISFVHKP